MSFRTPKLLAPLVGAWLAALGSAQGYASSAGIFDYAQTGCTCHGGALPSNTTTQLVIDGLPSAYAPGQSYDLTVWVLGAAIPLPGPGHPATYQNLHGFNLQVSAGILAARPGDGTVKTLAKTECQLVEQSRGCDPATTCGVAGDAYCRTPADCFYRYCSPPGANGCRLCSTALVDVQATHTKSTEALPGAYTDGNSVANWVLVWTAPNPGVGAVTFYLAGNAVNGNQFNDPGDLWSVLDPADPSPALRPRIVPQAR